MLDYPQRQRLAAARVTVFPKGQTNPEVAKADVASGDRVTALDISFDKNREGVIAALQAGADEIKARRGSR